MRLPDFILTNIEPILGEWEIFARSIWPGPAASALVLRDHAAEMLIAAAWDMKASQTDSEQIDKSKGHGEGGSSGRGEASDRVDDASNFHALSRLSSGFDLRGLVAEFRALRTSVVQLWIRSLPPPGPHEMQDVIRFNEVIDQLLSESIASFVSSVDASRECFLGILGHDLRNPLSSATMLAYLLAESTTLDPRCLHMAVTMRSSLDAMNHLIRDLLDFTGTRLGAKMTVLPNVMGLRPLCKEVLAEMRAIHPTRTFIFSSACEGEIAGEWDAKRLRQLISNLLGNAVQHGFATTPITVTVSSAETHVLLAFHNFGNCIPKEKLDVIFEPMKGHQSAVSRERFTPAGSIGLGLYIAREVAKAHGGTITVTSAGEETIFTVQLPRHPLAGV
ncbi:MAG: HAMP domain-containing sensor histidine kinase [Verrucomicrobiota bacterium]